MPVQAPHALWLMEEKGDSRQPPGEHPNTCSAPLSVLHPALILAAGEKPCCELLLGWDKLGNPQQWSWADVAALVGNPYTASHSPALGLGQVWEGCSSVQLGPLSAPLG